MKKLMITAAAAAMTAGAFAGVAQVYDMTINVKTTECKDGKKLVTDKCGNSYRFYRAQASYKFEGKFWGCGCATIAAPIPEQYGMPRLDSGLSALEMTCEDNNNSYMFWGAKAAFHHVDFAWPLLQLVGKDSKNVEGYFESEFFGCKDGELVETASLQLQGAGYGTAYIDQCLVSEDTVAEEYNHAFNYIKSMSGSVVGIYNVADLSGMVGCVYCGEEVGCTPFQFCNCVDLRENESAAYGTFTLKYNSGLANKVMNGKYIDEAYKFKSFVTTEFACIADSEEPEPTPEPTAKETAEKAYKTAVATYVAATNDLAKARAAEKAAGEACQNLKKTAQWIAGTNETVKLFAAVKTAKKALNELATDPNYVATVADVAAESAAYDAAVKSYIELSTELKYYGEKWTKAQTNAVATAKKTMEDAYIALENAMVTAAGGATVKANLKSAVAAYVAAAEAYYPVVAQYVGYAALQANAWDVDYANLTSYDVDGWKYTEYGGYISDLIPTVCAKDVNAIYEATVKDRATKATAATEAEDDMKTKKSICQALGGDCE